MRSVQIHAAHAFFARWATVTLTAFAAALLSTSMTFAQELDLKSVIREALTNNREILMAQSRVAAAGQRIPQAKSLPDPMVMFGYQNTSLSNYNYGMDDFSYWMFSASQMFPFPGKGA